MKDKTDSQYDTQRVEEAEEQTGFDEKVGTASHETGTNNKSVVDGGVVVRDFDGIQGSDDIVRTYRAPGGGHLYAYRGDDKKHHIVVSRGEKLGSHWEQRVPATQEYALPGQKVWTIPDNWKRCVYSERDSITYALFLIPESFTWAKVLIPTNDQLSDAWYCIKKVGDLNVGPVGNIGTTYDVYQLADEYEQYMQMKALLREVADNWNAVVEDLQSATTRVHDSLVTLESDEQPIYADDDWQITFYEDRFFRPLEVLDTQIHLSEHEITWLTVLEELRYAEILPSCYSFALSISDNSTDMEYYLRALLEAGASPAEAVDYYMLKIDEMVPEIWAKNRDVAPSIVEKNVEQAKSNLADPRTASE